MARWRSGDLFDATQKHVDRFGLLLGLTVISVAVLSLVDVGSPVSDTRSEVGWLLVTATVGFTLVAALGASGVARRPRRVVEIIVAAAVVSSGVVTAVDVFTPADLSSLVSNQPGWLWVVLSGLAPLLVVRRVLQHTEVSGSTIAGAISAFLLIALLANYAFLTLDTIQAGPFFGTPEPTTKFMYYSLVTLTTLGYGDLAAATDAGRLASTTEAVLGQVFLVTFVATLVSLRTGRMRLDRQKRAASGNGE